MATFRRTTVIDASLDAVWDFHSTIDGLEALTPDWAGLRVTNIIGPDGDRDPETLLVGTDIHLSMRPFGAIPGGSWTSRITERERDDDRAYFADVMLGGPFARWEHTHRFVGVGDQTVVYDSVDFALPRARRFATPVVELGLEAMFAYRHRRTRELLE